MVCVCVCVCVCGGGGGGGTGILVNTYSRVLSSFFFKKYSSTTEIAL